MIDNMTDLAFYEREARDCEHKRWLDYQKQGLSPEKIISQEKQWAHMLLKSAISGWQRCVFYAVAGFLIISLSAVGLFMMHGSIAVCALCIAGILVGAVPVVLFSKHAFKKPMLSKSRPWLLAEQLLNGAATAKAG